MGLSNIFRYRINGVIDTARPIIENMETLANSAGAWVSYDVLEGKWAVVINRPRTVDASFTDNNIIGSINVSGTGLSEFYNAVEVQYPNKDILDQSDWITIETPSELLNPNEQPNLLSINYPLVNEPTQAQLLGFIELKQSRLDLVVTFETDYSNIYLEPGFVIDITNSIYGWTNKLFRIVSISEIEDEEGIRLSITALEYDESVYATDDLFRYLRTNESGIITIGALGVPSTPQVTKIETATRPSIFIETTVPDNSDPLNEAGVVEGIEFWIYSIPPAELPTWEMVDDSTREYTLYHTYRSNSGQLLAPGEEIDWDLDGFDPGNFLVKCRAVNSSAAGEFSEHSGLVDYVPTQVAGAVGANTAILDDGNSPIAGLLGANTLMYLLGQLFNGNAQSPGVYSNVFSVFQTETGVDLPAVMNGGSPMVLVSSGIAANLDVVQSNSNSQYISVGSTPVFTPTLTTDYKVDIIADQNGSSAFGGRGSAHSEVEDFVRVRVDLVYDSNSSIITSLISGGVGAFFWTDYAMTGIATLQANVDYKLDFYVINYTADGAGGNANFDFGWNVYTIG